ncbi:RecQ family ATP-dependent DNA helicase [Flavobacterium salilacus subsp. salilacus]|uniref:RecQ family ATP-dependent DNA helicase n=1 Tax=Flavobacterium TaxID=237 RepID=UPI001074DC6F|nr:MULTISPECIES: ATP-dependent DNA helicase RecQ [Flavobacterium]KAF2519356.1 RecQ family ATP-dependent DNA helicase [Flavobacterium salilacus subsp. salilacus]MBE1614753.1 RecQ family ATP-dependent DNA helicase [Flavobacterium sp. SaA2.13]
MQHPLEILKKYWQYDSFREPQDKIIQSVLEGKDAFALMPTGGGKSICFQVPALIKPGLCLVISPLIALMKDQVANLSARGIKAIALTGGLSPDAISDQLDNCKFGDYKFLYVSPERLQAEWIIERIKELPINLVAIDEAHCVSQWGHDFRPAYLKISALKKQLPNVPFLALTASATKRVQEDIATHLGLENPVVYKKSFFRENIAYMVLETEDKLHRLQQILTKNPEPSIIYVRNRKSCHDVSQQLQSLGFKATHYHGGLKEKEKEANMQAWMQEKVQVIVATNAFGMGIDKANVKTVIHIQLPENLENYYQEAGRAGRIGKKSFAVLLINKSDIAATQNQFIEVLPDKKFLKNVYSRLNNYLQIAYGEGIGQTFPFNLNEFCRHYDFPVVKTYNALQFLDRQGIVTLSKEFSESITLQFLVPSKEVLRYISLNPADETMILTILRNYAGVFDMETAINANFINKKAKSTEQELLTLMQRLQQKGVITYTSKGADSSLTFNEVREDDLTINRVTAFLEQQNKIKVKQFEAIVHYATNNNRCKSRLLLDYFEEKESADCGICSYCINKHKESRSITYLAEAVLQLLENDSYNSREIEQKLELTPKETVYVLQVLLENGKIKINMNNQYTIK